MIIIEWTSGSGESPFRLWLESLDLSVRARIQARIFRIEEGNLGDHKSVGKGVWEVRLDFGPGYRIYFGTEGSRFVVFLVGGDKSSQRKDIKRAQEMWSAYLTEE